MFGQTQCEVTYLVIHERVLLLNQEQPANFVALLEPFVLAAFATAVLALYDGVDEARHHVELRPVDLGGVVVVVVGISFVGSNEVGEVNLSGVRSVQRVAKRNVGIQTMRVYMHLSCSSEPYGTSDVTAQTARAGPIAGSSSSVRSPWYATARGTRRLQM